MKKELTACRAPSSLARIGIDRLPRLIADAGENASRRFVEFFVATIRNKNTRLAYARATRDFLEWCEARGFSRLAEVRSPVRPTFWALKRPPIKTRAGACFGN